MAHPDNEPNSEFEDRISDLEEIENELKLNTEKQQQDLVDSIKHELSKKNKFHKPSSFWHSVWFHPLSGRFLFADQFIRYEVVEPLIENKTIVFKGIENHQGEKMFRYVLSQDYL
jgi:hypothetical protein